MKVRVAVIVLVCISLIAGLAGRSIAAIDLSTLEGLWLFDEGVEDVAIDSSGNGLDGEFTGKPGSVEGRFGKALEFDGASYYTIPDHENPTEAITISAWVKSSTTTWNNHGWIVEKRDAYILHPNAGSINLSFCIANGGIWNLPNAWDTGAVGPPDGDITEWHMYTCTFDSETGEWRIYIDGEVESELDLTKAEISLDSGPVNIGVDSTDAARTGLGTVDEVAIFSVALSEDDIQTMMNGFEMILAVQPADKLSTTWAGVKTQY